MAMASAVGDEFELAIAPFRRELLVHCYRMLGSVHDAQDLVQETLARAWRAFDRYDPNRASLRTWLYRIATNACLTALQARERRPLPSGVGQPFDDPDAAFVPALDVPWLEPFPDALLTPLDDPGERAIERARLRLAMVAALQLLSARQRAVLILREVLDVPAAEVAAVLDTTTAAVNSALQRARARLDAAGVDPDSMSEPDDAQRTVVDRYVSAFERADISGLIQLLADDVVLEMPPMLNWYVGPARYAGFIARVFNSRGTDWQMRPLAANGQAAVAAYVRPGSGDYELHTLQVFTVERAAISRTTVFQDAAVFALFDLPATISARPAG
jgi:RNA polymerase sigma-70 factor, ECF subfamily